MNKTMLKTLGFSKNEIESYTYILENGESTPPGIAAEVGIGRQNSYAVLSSLENKGLIKKDSRHNKLHYFPAPPEALLEIAEKKEEAARVARRKVRDELPSLKSFYNLAKDRPGISTFSGVDGAKMLYRDTIRRGPKEILVVFSEKGKGRYLEAWIKRNYSPERVSNGTKIKEIINTKEKNSDERLKELLWEKKYIDMPEMPRDMDILIYGNNVTFINFSKKEITGFTVDDVLVSGVLRSFFNCIWS